MRWIRRGVLVIVLGAIGAAIQLCMAASGSPLAPSWLYASWVVFASAAGLVMLLAGIVAFQRETTGRFVWRTDNEVPAEAAPEARRGGQLRPPLPAHFLLGMLLALVAAFTYLPYPKVREWGALRTRGAETTGTVTDIHRQRVEYTYHAGAETRRDHARVTPREARALLVGNSIPVTYLASAPYVSSPRPKSAFTWRRGFVQGFASDLLRPLFPMFVLLVLVPAVMKAGRDRLERLYRNGSTAIATVTSVFGSRVEYTFTIPDGTFAGIFVSPRGSDARPAVGDHFVVLYDLAKPKTNMPWALAASAFV